MHCLISSRSPVGEFQSTGGDSFHAVLYKISSTNIFLLRSSIALMSHDNALFIDTGSGN